MKKFAGDIKEYWYFCRFMAKTGLKAEVANSYLNWIWWVLEPLASMAVYYLIFVNVLGRDQPYYLVFIYTGSVIWSFFERCMLYDVQAVRLNRDIVTRAYLPKPMLVISNMIFNDLKMLISAAILLLIFVVSAVPVTLYMLYVIPLIILLQLFVLGAGLLLMHFGVFIDDLRHALGIFLRIAFYVTGIFYDLTKVLGDTWGRILIAVNPMAFIISSVRDALIYGKAPSFILLAVWTAISVILCIIGIRLSYRYENTYAKII